MAKNGHWYTDKQGKHYFVEEGQSPKEGWEASKRRKMISGGKYKVSEDGNDYRDVDMDEYNNYEADEDEWDATRDEDIDGFDEEGDIEYNREMQKAQEENAAMSEGKDNPASVDALYRPDEDKGPRESKGPADPNAPAGQVLYNQDDEEFLKDMGANLKNTQYGRQETLDKYYERVRYKHTDDMDDWKAFISTAYAMSPKEVDRYIKLKDSKGLEYDKTAAEKFKNAGFDVASEEEMNKLFGRDNNLPGAKPSSAGNRLKFKLPNQEEQVGTIESLDESGINAFGKKQKLYVVRTPDGRRIEVPGEYVVKPEYPDDSENEKISGRPSLSQDEEKEFWKKLYKPGRFKSTVQKVWASDFGKNEVQSIIEKSGLSEEDKNTISRYFGLK